jgi:hypothetical protein
MRSIAALAVACIAACSGCARTVRIERRWHLAPWADESRHLVVKPVQLAGKSDGDDFVIETQEAWEAIWRSVGKPAPHVNFKTHVVVGAQRNSLDPLIGFRITHIERRPGGCVVHIRIDTLPPGAVLTNESRGVEADYVLIRRTSLPYVIDEHPVWYAPREWLKQGQAK